MPSLAYPISLEGEREKGPVEIEAQKMVYNGKAALVIMEGDVVIRYGGSELHAEKAVYYLEKHYAIAEGEVALREGAMSWSAGEWRWIWRQKGAWYMRQRYSSRRGTSTSREAR
ncbi:MAG: hypothetical protein DRG32_03430 [Deltaproteobacteria bacterium]|nr:MAG: hypothetical protein DRG32_03430 [Deltaproteobacteria bacterium]